MNPEERRLLERTLKLAEENNKILQKVDARARRAAIYGFIKVVLIVAPFVIGYLFLEPYINQAVGNYQNIKDTLNSL